MRELLHLTDFVFTTASPDDRRTGLLGWVSCRLNGQLGLDGIAVRRTAEGRLALSFPARRDRHGREHAYVRPLDSDARAAIEKQVFEALRVNAGGES